jgi:hypothetical protein
LNAVKEQPFFIIGVHRSGTTLLRFILSSHSRIFVPPETDFIPYFFAKDPTGELSDGRIGEILEIIFERYRFVEEWKGEKPEVSELLSRMDGRTPAAFLDALYLMYAQQNGAVRWGDKTPIYASYVDLIHQIFPEARFIHILRDPFDAGISLLEKYEKDEFHIDSFYAGRNWVRRIKLAQRAGQRLGPELFYELRYEDLVADPEKEVKAICKFLGEDFESEMLEQHHLAQDRIAEDSHFFANVRKPISVSSVGRGREALSKRDKRVIQALAGPLMDEVGYQRLDLGAMPVSEAFRFMVLGLKYFILQAGRRVLQALGYFPPI